MKSVRPKVLHPIAGRPMLAHLIETLKALPGERVHVVVGKGADAVKAAFPDSNIDWVDQAEQQGTGHAVMQAMPGVNGDTRLLILLGDAPLVTAATMKRLIEADCDLGVLTVDQPDPYNYGRILRGSDDEILNIVEERDASDAERQIREVNTGVMVAHARLLGGWLEKLNNHNDQEEYLLTDIVKIAAAEGCRVRAVKAKDRVEVLGVNTFGQLAVLEREFQRRAAEQLMAAGVHLVDPARIDVRGRLHTGQDVSIDVNCIFEGACTLGDKVTVGPNCVVRDSFIGDNCEIRANSVIEGAKMEADCVIGPFARIRPGTQLAQDVRIGNFVEVKAAIIGTGTRASHLSYLGDATLGTGVNIGAGTITCNYDGVAKHGTRIDDHVFVGSNTALVAPVIIGEGSTIAAGSTITKDVGAHQLGIARGRQRSVTGWKGPRDN